MLCRAVLAAAAVSCTFSLALANSQGTDLVQLKDLVCVLWLSGLQKEDLDVNLLRKLERHNVNIDDLMNNETMRRECAPKKAESTSITTKKPVLKMKITASLSTTLDPAKSANVTKDKYFDTLVNLMSSSHPANSNVVEESKNEKSKKIAKIKSLLKTTMSSAKLSKTNTSPQSTSTKARRPLEFLKLSRTNTPSEPDRETDFKPKNENMKLQNILNFWQKMSKARTPSKMDDELSALQVISSKNLFKQNPPSKRVPTLMTFRPFLSTSTSAPDIEEFIADFMSKNMDQLSTTTSTTTPEVNVPDDLGDTFLPLYKDLLKKYDYRQTTEDAINEQVETKILKKITQQRFLDYNKATTDEHETSEKVRGGDFAFSDIENLFKTKERIDNPLQSNIYLKELNFDYGIPNRPEGLPDTRREAKYDDNKKRIMKKSIPANTDKHPDISKKMLDDIAKSVKAMILKDISKMMPSTPSYTQQVTELPMFLKLKTAFANDLDATPPPSLNKTDANQVMDKILEIYERIKTISDKTDLSLDHNKQLNLNHDANCLNPNIATHSKTDLNIGRRSKEADIPSHMITHTNVVHRTSNVHNILMNPTSFRDLTQQEIQKMPSIIQTNSGEIAPIMMPYANPLKIVNQILVVTTESAATKSDVNEKSRSRFESFMADLKRSRIHALGQNKNEPRHSIPEHERYAHFGYPDIIRSRKEHEAPSKYEHSVDSYAQPHRYRTVHRDDTNVKIRNYKDIENVEHINYSDYVLGDKRDEKIPMHRHRETYHEQLEKSNGRWSERESKPDFTASEREREHSRNVAPRLQKPLNGRNPYDDTHFRNFLKTQQKVNDMLEKILGTKAKLGGYSVETT